MLVSWIGEAGGPRGAEPPALQAWDAHRMAKARSRLTQAQLLLDEADKRVASCVRRMASMYERLGILVGTSAIAGTLATTAHPTGWTKTALGSIVVGAVLGVIGLAPSKSRELDWNEIRGEIWPLSDEVATVRLADKRKALADRREKEIKAKSRFLTVGFSFLAAAVVLLFISTLGVQIVWQ